MNKENASKLWKMTQEAGDYLRSQQYTLANTTLHYLTLPYTTLHKIQSEFLDRKKKLLQELNMGTKKLED